jgi:putative PIG3 family NAD(P)H quinone oxidoreductase
MRAVMAAEPGGPEVLELTDLPDLSPAPGELLVAVHAAGVNRADVLQRRGLYPPPAGASEVLGLEVSGVVADVGEGVSGWSPGDPVCAVLAGGGYAEQALVPASTALPPPTGLDLVSAAAVPEVFTTAWENLVNRGRLAPGEAVLIHGGGSGVGTAAIQLAKRLGCRVLVTAGSLAKLEECAALGADGGINHRSEDFVERTRALTDGRGVDVVLDIIGADYLAGNIRVLSPGGRLVVIGLMGGAKAELDLGTVMSRRLTVTGSTLRSRSVAEKAVLADGLRKDVWPGFADGTLRPVIDRVLPLAEAAEAHRVMEASEHTGKILLRVRDDVAP